jgi:hypothetical protein
MYKKIKLWEAFINNSKYKKYFISNEELWKKSLDDVKIFLNKNKKAPSNGKKEEGKLAVWIYRQQDNYKNNSYMMQYEEIYNLWKNFIEEYKEYILSNEDKWNKNYIDAKNYIKINKKLPSMKDNRFLSSWIRHNQYSYIKKENLMLIDKYRDIWSKFIEEYDKYFYNPEKMWFEQLNKVKNFINNYNRKPINVNRSNKENMPSYRVNMKAAIEKIKEIKTHRNNVEKMLGVPLKSKKKT